LQEHEDLLETGVGDFKDAPLVECILWKKTTVQVRSHSQGLLNVVREVAVPTVELIVKRYEEKDIEPTVEEEIFLLASVFVAFPERL